MIRIICKVQMLSSNQARYILAALLIFLSFSFFSLKSYAEDSIVSIYIVDGGSFTERNTQYIFQFIDKVFPQKKHVKVMIDSKGRTAEEVRSLVISNLQGQLRSDDIVSYLFIGTHGEVVRGGNEQVAEKLRNFDPNNASLEEMNNLMDLALNQLIEERSLLNILGEFGPSGPDSELSEVLAPLKGKMADNAVILFDSCKVFCGAPETVAQRVSSLAQYLGVENGTFFGSLVNVRWTEILPPGRRNWTFVKSNIKTITFAALGFGVVSASLTGLTGEFNWDTLMNGMTALASSFGLSLPILTLGPDLVNVLERVKYRSRAFVQKEGEIYGYENLTTLGVAWKKIKQGFSPKDCSRLLLDKKNQD